MSLKDAPKHVKIAVDLIMILEDNAVTTEDALKALKIVEQDFIRKQQAEKRKEL